LTAAQQHRLDREARARDERPDGLRAPHRVARDASRVGFHCQFGQPTKCLNGVDVDPSARSSRALDGE
jgi:hypothetical protein